MKFSVFCPYKLSIYKLLVQGAQKAGIFVFTLFVPCQVRVARMREAPLTAEGMRGSVETARFRMYRCSASTRVGSTLSLLLSLLVFLSHIPLSPSLPAPASTGTGRPGAPHRRKASPSTVADSLLHRFGLQLLRDDDRDMHGGNVCRCSPEQLHADSVSHCASQHLLEPEHPRTQVCQTSQQTPAVAQPERLQPQPQPRLRGGNDEDGGDTFAQDVEGGNVESALADPDMTKVRAFMPRELRRGLPDGFGSSSFSLKSLLLSKCWFYPLPPWGRKDVFNCESRFLQFWHLVMIVSI